MQSLADLSRDLRDLVSRVGASVVQVRGRRGYGASGLVWAEDLVLTSARTLEREEELVVTIAGEPRAAERVGEHPASDLLLLRVGGGLPQFARASTLPELGELVLALSRAGERLRARLGLVSSTGPEWRLPGGARMERYIETDFAPSPALAGSALIGMDGSLIGINHPGLLRGAVVTLPAASLTDPVSQMAAHGRVRRGHLGVMVHPVRLPASLAAELRRTCGLIVMSVRDGSPAERAGVLLGDVLLELAGEALSRPEELEAALGDASIEGARELRVLRSGSLRSLKVQVEERS